MPRFAMATRRPPQSCIDSECGGQATAGAQPRGDNLLAKPFLILRIDTGLRLASCPPLRSAQGESGNIAKHGRACERGSGKGHKTMQTDLKITGDIDDAFTSGAQSLIGRIASRVEGYHCRHVRNQENWSPPRSQS